MKPYLLASVALVTMSTPLLAADLATRYPVKAMPPAVFSWTGFYVGGNVGYAGDSFSADALLFDALSVNNLVSYDGSGTASITSSGFIAGGQVGYNYQFANNVVVGVETDLQWSGIEGRADAALDATSILIGSANVGASIDYFGTIRARLGYAFDRFLPYVTGGAAYGRTAASGDAVILGVGSTSVSAASDSWGWTVGAGAEFAVTNNWTVKAEYLYVDLGSMDYAVYEPLTSTAAFGSVDSKFHAMKAGVNYKF